MELNLIIAVKLYIKTGNNYGIYPKYFANLNCVIYKES